VTPPKKPGEQWTETLLYSFAGADDGEEPVGACSWITRAISTGRRTQVAARVAGTAFQLTRLPNWGSVDQDVRHDFGGCCVRTERGGYQMDGAGPDTALIIGYRNELYGTAAIGGKSGEGTLYKLRRPQLDGGDWAESAIHIFSRSGSKCANRSKNCIGGTLFGTTAGQVGSDNGTVSRWLLRRVKARTGRFHTPRIHRPKRWSLAELQPSFRR